VRPVLIALVIAMAAAVAIFYVVFLLTVAEDSAPEVETVSFATADGGHLNITCEVADDTFERTKGLQHREDLPMGKGMLFVYDEPAYLSFIMPNMNFPLDIIFIAENGTVVNVEEAEPEDPGTPRSDYVRYRSDGEVKWVVEINQGLSREHGIGPGTRVLIGTSG
jgi:uncharacterized membrane protein (UPF0127 family)